MKFELRSYQADGVTKLRESYRSGRRAPLYVLPTGGGKTAVFSYIAENVRARGKRAIIIAHRQELLSQASKSLSRLGVSHGMISPKFSAAAREQIQVASIQTLVRRLDKVTAPDLLIFDEAHHTISKSYRTVIERYSQAHILGVTATPCRTSGEGLNEIFDDLIIGPTIRELITLDFLVKPIVYAPPVGIDLHGIHKRGGDYAKDELGARVDKPKITGCAVEHYLKLARGEPSIAFCVSVKHAEHVASEFCKAGVRAVSVDGGMDDTSRRNALKALEDGTVDVITSADLIGEGVDIPRVSTAILLRPTASLSLYLQQCGRALRPYEGKTRALILDHVGNTLKHGFVDDEFDWSLEAAPKAKNKNEEEGVKIIQCQRCYFVYERGPQVCPSCGFESVSKIRRIDQVNGELEQLDRDKIAAARAKRREQGAAKNLDDLIKLGQTRGYKNPKFWAERVIAARRRG